MKKNRFTNRKKKASLFYKNGCPPWENTLKGCNFMKNILSYESPQESFDFLQKNGCPPWKNTLKACDFMNLYFLFYFILQITTRESVDFLQKNGCPPWKNTLKGCNFMKKYFLFYFTNHHKRASIFYKKIDVRPGKTP